MTGKALGLIETRGLVALLEAADIAAKTADVELLGYTISGGGLVTIWLSGQVAPVKAAVQAGLAGAGKIGEVISGHVIPRPNEKIWDLGAESDRRQISTGPGDRGGHTPETSVTAPETSSSGEAEKTATCNLCKDAGCPRHKGEPRARCIHYGDPAKIPEDEIDRTPNGDVKRS